MKGGGLIIESFFFFSPIDGPLTGRGELIIVSRGTYQNQFTVLASFSIISPVTGSPRPLCIFVSQPFHRLLKINKGVPQTINLPLRTGKGQFLIHHYQQQKVASLVTSFPFHYIYTKINSLMSGSSIRIFSRYFLSVHFLISEIFNLNLEFAISCCWRRRDD